MTGARRDSTKTLLIPQGVSRPGSPAELRSGVVSLSFRIVEEAGRSRIEVVHLPDGQRWVF